MYINYFQHQGMTYTEAVSSAIAEILEHIETDMSILQQCRQQWYTRKTAGTLTDEFDKTCKELADSCKKNIAYNKSLLI